MDRSAAGAAGGRVSCAGMEAWGGRIEAGVGGAPGAYTKVCSGTVVAALRTVVMTAPAFVQRPA
ncbi:hypothetical protein RSP816_17090 (plasmid) [Ralstonia solanacearum]|nr:hypothetical protein RSP597_21575 [Ralstonia solanacearum]RCW07679.1 hypothetical protein RSP816_17090 [Ralstonia solanacearum]